MVHLTQQLKSHDDGIDAAVAAAAGGATKLEQWIIVVFRQKMLVYCAALGSKNLDSKELRQGITFHK